MSPDTLHTYSLKDLAQLAKKRGVRGWHSMKKEQLVKELLRAARAKSASRGKKVAAPRVRTAAARVAPPKPKSPRVVRRLLAAREQHERLKSLAYRPAAGKPSKVVKDRLVVMVRDAYWLHAYWELTHQSVSRAEAALGQEWHLARPALRLLEVTGAGTSSSSEVLVRHIEIHGGVNNWYIDVQDPPKSYRLEVGYLCRSGRFFPIARSNIVATPSAGAHDEIDGNWTDVAQNVETIYALSGGATPDGASPELQELFEERLRRPIGTPLMSRFGSTANGLLGRRRDFQFAVEAELLVYGHTKPDARVTLSGSPVKLREDGSFTLRFSLPNGRQVIPAVACSSDGLEQRTIVLAVERNTKAMEPFVREATD